MCGGGRRAAEKQVAKLTQAVQARPAHLCKPGQPTCSTVRARACVFCVGGAVLVCLRWSARACPRVRLEVSVCEPVFVAVLSACAFDCVLVCARECMCAPVCASGWARVCVRV